jgi:putative FmdB family regulatory protein
LPIYEYECRKCGAVNEVLTQRGAPAPPCPECGSKDVRKAFSLVALIGRQAAEAQCEGFSEGCAAECPSARSCAMAN